MSGASIVDRIVEQNLGVYRSSPSRLQEDVSQEAQVANDYRGRLAYELLQNADDSMSGQATHDDRVAFLVTNDALWMANTGRPLTDDDVQGLCGLGASSKVDARGVRRASIGHKGLGFKSVLEITDEPGAYSETLSFELGAKHARPIVEQLWADLNRPRARGVPAMRFPTEIHQLPAQWIEFSKRGFNTAFHLPFRDGITPAQRQEVADRLLAIPITAVLFLKHLEHVEVVIDQAGRSLRRSWSVRRSTLDREGVSTPTSGLSTSGLYRVLVTSEGEEADFLVAHHDDLEIGQRRVGLSGPAWEGVELTEVSVAIMDRAPEPSLLPDDWRHLHVFLPTEEPNPYPFLVNGAFVTDLARQHVKVSDDPMDYNAHLLRHSARLLCEQLMPQLLEGGSPRALAVLDRGASTDPESTAGTLHRVLSEELERLPLLELETGGLIPVRDAIFPPLFLGDRAADYRGLLAPDAHWEDRRFPGAVLCQGRFGAIATDHGARVLSPEGSLTVLARVSDGARAALTEHPTGGLEVDPVLEMCARIWAACPADERAELAARAKDEPLFPVAREGQRVIRTQLRDTAAFYPPRSASQDLPLSGLSFMLHSVCWGALIPQERTALLEEQMRAWGALFEVRDFKFEEVYRAAIGPALVSNPDEDVLGRRRGLQSVESLAAICQLAGALTKPDRPLPTQRLGGDRALFNLSRLRVPCRSSEGVVWKPAYRVYFGRDWIGEASVERLLGAMSPEATSVRAVEVEFLAPPSYFTGHLEGFEALASEEGDQAHDEADQDDDEEVGLDEDTDRALEVDEGARWLAFLSWIGVNHALRLVHFHDVDDRDTGWVHTKDLSQPGGWAFVGLGDLWDQYRTHLFDELGDFDRDGIAPYAYAIHDLDQIAPILAAAERDPTATVARALFEHLAANWTAFERHAEAELALVSREKWPNSRTKPPRATVEERTLVGQNLWLFRLRRRGICPTTVGPRRPEIAWRPTTELQRRFGRRNRPAGDFLPVLDISSSFSRSRLDALSGRFGIRGDPSPSTFTPDDARMLCERIRDRFEGQPDRISESLRAVIKPLYREMFELLSGRSTDERAAGLLAGVPLLVQSGSEYRFVPSNHVFYVRAPGSKGRMGLTGELPTFVLDAEAQATAPLGSLFRARAVEDAIEWIPDFEEVDFDLEEVGGLRAGLRDLVAPLLARVRVERSDERDAKILAAFVTSMIPVEELSLECRLDGREVGTDETRGYYVRREPQFEALIQWDGPAWPPVLETAQRLAMALADALGVNMIETFIAFITASNEQRRRLLQISGAADSVQDAEAELEEETTSKPMSDQAEEGGERSPAPEAGEHVDDHVPVSPQIDTPAAPPVELVRFEDLRIFGEPVLVTGDPRDPDGHRSSEPDAAGRSGGRTTPGAPHQAAPGTDMSALDDLGMRIAIGYEINRLRGARVEGAEALLGEGPEPGGSTLVVDVHTPAAIRLAETRSPVAKHVLLELEQQGISRIHPGFDLLTIRDGEPDRLIELKSSGVDARVQTMSWNEWKSAGHRDLQERFWLYLVGNLRADLQGTTPYVKAIRDPFGTLARDEVTEEHVRRAVQLRVREFDGVAERLDLEVTPRGAMHKRSRR